MKTINYVILALLLLTTNFITAQSGTLDSSFNGNGSEFTRFGIYDSSVHSMVVQPDGKIISAGTVFNQGDFSQFGLVRLNSDGSLDATFGDAGLAIGNFLQSKMTLNTIVLQSDGKIVAAGMIYNNYANSQFVLTRFNNNGTIDTTFGTNGVIIGDSVYIYSMILQADQKIIVAGFTFDSADTDFVLIKYNKDGIIDASFGIAGIAKTNIGLKDFGYDIALQSDGKIVLVGAVQNTSGQYFSDFAALRYNNDGNPDATFGTGGKVTINSNDIDEARSVEIQSDGKIVLSGSSYSPSGLLSAYKLVRLLPNGSLDNGFGTNGIVTSQIMFNGDQQLIEIQPDSKILIAGSYWNGKSNEFALARYQTTGVLDSTFGLNGIVTTSDGAETNSQANAIVQQPDGQILVGGESGEASLSYHPNSTLRRYNK